MSESVMLNGEIISADEARVSVYNGGWLHGAGLFETMRAQNGAVFRLDRHLDRLRASADQLLAPIDRSQLPDADGLRRLMERNELGDARLRLTVTAGHVLTTQREDTAALTVCVTAAPVADYPQVLYKKGVTVMISRYRQSAADPLAGHKTTSYLPRLIALKEANAARCTEAIWFTNTNHVAEGCISNVFVVKNGKVTTPPVDMPVLPGITRQAALELCATDEIDATEAPIDINGLLDADEVFITNVIMQVMPVVGVERRQIGDGRPGVVTCKLMRGFRALVAGECHA